MSTFTDLKGLQAIAVLMVETTAFRRVDLRPNLPLEVTPDDLPLCWVQPGNFVESSSRSLNHPTTPDRMRVVSFHINILGPEDPDNPGFCPMGVLEELEEVVSAAIEGQGLGGAVAGLTRIEKSEPVKNRGVRLVGSFTVLPDL